MVDRRTPLGEGARSVAPLLVGVAPFGLVTGATAVDAGFPPGLTVAMSALVFAGASQLAVIELVRSGATPAVVVGTAAVVNLRYLMYSASVAPYFRSFGRVWRTLLGYLLTDQTFALSVTRYERADGPAGRGGDPAARKWYYVGVAVPVWAVWMAGTVAGVVVGARVPPEWSLGFAIPLTFLALLVPAVGDRSTAVAAAVAGVVAVGGAGLPFNLGLVVAALVGVTAGAAVDRRDGGGPGDGDRGGGPP
jgi:predicted branched-subunit amino acid permease